MTTRVIDIEDVISGKVNLPENKWKSRNPFEIEDLVSVTILDAGEDLPECFYVCHRSKYHSEYRMILPEHYREYATSLAAVMNESIENQSIPIENRIETEKIVKLYSLLGEAMTEDTNQLIAKYGKL